MWLSVCAQVNVKLCIALLVDGWSVVIQLSDGHATCLHGRKIILSHWYGRVSSESEPWRLASMLLFVTLV